MSDPDGEALPAVIPVIEEELVTGREAVKTGSVRVHKRVERIRKIVEMPAVHDVVRVTRVAVNRPVTSAPRMREEGDTLIIPVVEEEIVVQKRLVLKEEIHVQRRKTSGRIRKAITLGREHAVVERLDSEGNVIARSEPSVEPRKSLLSQRPKSILK